MCQIFEDVLLEKLGLLQEGLQLRTPYNAIGQQFSITQVNQTTITITLASGNPLQISLAAFISAMYYLIRNGHDLTHPVDIASNNNARSSGPLCHVTRMQNNNIRCINYVLPVLESFGYVGISGQRPNSCWYI